MSNYIRKLNPTFDEYEGESYLRSLQFINEEPQPILDAKLSELMSTATRMDDCDCLLVYPEKHCFEVYQAADGSYFIVDKEYAEYQEWQTKLMQEWLAKEVAKRLFGHFDEPYYK